MSVTEIRKLLNLFESIMLNELTDKVKQQQFERLKRENSAKLSELTLQYNDLENKIKDIEKQLDQEYDFFADLMRDKNSLVAKKEKLYQKIQEEKKKLVPDDKIKMYIDLWDEYSQGFPPEVKDITKLSLNQIIQLTRDADFKKYLRGKKSRFFNDQSPNPDLDTLYNKNNLTIMKGDLREKCIRYGEGYSWCISRKDSQNLFFSYRMRLEEPMFYFVFDKDRPKTDKYHAMVIYVDNNGVYKVASAENTGDTKMSWNDIITIQPKLNGLQKLFKHKPLTPNEKSDYQKYKNVVSDEVYQNFSLEEKYKYIKFGNTLTPKQQNITPDDLIGVYAKLMPNEITKFTFDRIKSGDKRKVISDIIDENNNIDATDFAMTVLRTPWHMSGLPEDIVKKAHKKIASNAGYSYRYAKRILSNNDYNPTLVPQEIMQSIASNADNSYRYAELILDNNDYNQKLIPQEIIKGIASYAGYSYYYAKRILSNNDYNPTLVPQEIMQSIASNADNSYRYAELILDINDYNQKLIPQEIMQSIASDADNSYYYARDILSNNDYNQKLIPQEIIKGIASNAGYSYRYAKRILSNNDYNPTLVPQEIMQSIASNADNSYEYAELILINNDYNPTLVPQEIIKGIASYAGYSYRYAELILDNNDYNQKLIPQEIINAIKKDNYIYTKYKKLTQQNESIDLTRLKQLSGII